jgi:hypothetical protein
MELIKGESPVEGSNEHGSEPSKIHESVEFLTMLGGSLVTTAWRVLRLRMEGTPSRYGG